MTVASAGYPFAIAGSSFVVGARKIDVGAMFPEAPTLVERTGIPKVYEADSSAYQLALSAVNKLFMERPDRRSCIGAVLYVTESPSWFLPSHACRLQADAQLPTDILALDIGQGCSGFVQAMCIAVRFLSEMRDVLVVTADIYRSKLEAGDRSTQAIFSDGAAAIIFTSQSPTHRLVGEDHITDGSGADLLVQDVGSCATSHLSMSGRDIYLWTRRTIPAQLDRLCGTVGVSVQSLDVALVHQASRLVIDGLRDYLEPLGVRVPVNLDTWGNTVSSSIPGLIADGYFPTAKETAIVAGFGVGLSSSAAVIEPV